MLIPCVVARPGIGPDSQSLAFDLILPPCTQQEGEKSFRLLQESNWLASMHAIHYPFTSNAFMSKWVTRDWKNLSRLPEARMERFQQGMSFSAFLIFWCWFSFVIFSGNFECWHALIEKWKSRKTKSKLFCPGLYYTFYFLLFYRKGENKRNAASLPIFSVNYEEKSLIQMIIFP